jgi:hypothetical protein
VHLLRFLLILGVVLVPVVVSLVFVVRLLRKQQQHARAAGYPSLRAYLRAAPQTDEEKMAATDLALKGLVLCMFGLFFAPLMLLGLFPLFYGARKVLYASMGLGLLDDARQPPPPQRGV